MDFVMGVEEVYGRGRGKERYAVETRMELEE